MQHTGGDNQLIIVFCTGAGYLLCEQMLGKATELKNIINGKICVVVSDNLKDDIICKFEIDQIVECSALKDNDLYAGRIVAEILDRYKPVLVLIPDYEGIRSAAAYAAVALNFGIVADCIDIIASHGNYPFYFRRTAYSESAIVDIAGKNTSTIICIVKLNSFKSATKISMFHADVQRIVFNETYYKNKNVKLVDSVIKYNSLEELWGNGEKTVIGIGNGVEKEDVNLLIRLAGCIGADVGYTRAAVESGIGLYDLQIGQSGHFISADLYIAFGISGSIHHVCALNNCKKIIAINKDPLAAIFDYCDWGMCMDVRKIIRELAVRLL